MYSKKSHSLEWLFSIGVLIIALTLAGCSREPSVYQLSGSTMGTTWHVTVLAGADSPAQGLVQERIEAELVAVNASMSTYLETSEISQFNNAPIDSWFGVSQDFYHVLSAAFAVGFQSQGAYDITVGPLVNLWGFGPSGAVISVPGEDAVAEVLQNVGQGKLRLDGDAMSVMKSAPVYLDFSSIAKGYAVDQVARYLESKGFADYLIEVGGEMRLSGASPREDVWRIAIEQPDSGGTGIARAIRVTNAAVATSGDYRNYFEVDGQRYSHTIDPRTGYPVKHELVSVTVIHSSSMMADAWATALTVLGLEAGMTVAQANGLAVYFITRSEDNFNSSHTAAFKPFLEGL